MLEVRCASGMARIRGHRPRYARPPEYPTVCHGHPVQSLLLTSSLKQAWTRPFVKVFCGERGIRTPETLLEFTRFPGVPLQPLEHLSFALATSNLATLSGTIHLTTRKGTKNIWYIHKNLHFFCFFSQFYNKKCFCIGCCCLNYVLYGAIIHLCQTLCHMSHPATFVAFSTIWDRSHIRGIGFQH